MDSSKQIIEHLKSIANNDIAEKSKYFGVKADNILGISSPELRNIAKKIKTNHGLALELWREDYHEAKMLSTIIADKKKITKKEIDTWATDFDSWDIVDGACYNLIRYTEFYDDIIFEYCKSQEEYIRRTSFALIAGLAVSRKDIKDEEFLKYLPLIEEYSFDNRNFVWKAVNWALRQIGKRSQELYPYALALSEKLSNSENPVQRKIGKGAYRELKDEKIIARIK
ncbi:MAG: DNA alkylation repair protein [Bacteroidales bacterium]